MSVIDDYIQPLSADKRAALERFRTIAHELIPDAEETISYMLPCFRWKGKVVFGFAARKEGISLYPFSGAVIPEMEDRLTEYKHTPGAIQISLDKPLPDDIIRDIIQIRMAMISEKH